MYKFFKNKFKNPTPDLMKHPISENKKELKERAKMSVFTLVRIIREQRFKAVQIEQQYQMVYDYFKKLGHEFLE